MSNFTIIPNSFQYPNYYNDVLDQYLTPEESKVLTRAIREIFGWEEHRQTHSAQISLTTFQHGNKRIGSAGIGLERKTIISALNALDTFRILIKVGKANNPHGQTYKLNLNVETIDIEGLKQRVFNRRLANKKRTEPARKKKQTCIEFQVSDNTSTGVSDNTSTGVSDNTSTGVSDTPTENHKKTKENQGNIHHHHQTINSRDQQNSDGGGVGDEINTIFSRSKRPENITAKHIERICANHELKSPAEILKAVQYLAAEDFYFAGSRIENMIGFLIGKHNGNGRESSCFFGGECIFPEPNTLPSSELPGNGNGNGNGQPDLFPQAKHWLDSLGQKEFDRIHTILQQKYRTTYKGYYACWKQPDIRQELVHIWKGGHSATSTP